MVGLIQFRSIVIDYVDLGWHHAMEGTTAHLKKKAGSFHWRSSYRASVLGIMEKGGQHWSATLK